jgi:hypothetical protein
LIFKNPSPLGEGLMVIVRIIGVEPTCLAAPDPKSGASANFAISAGNAPAKGCKRDAKVRVLFKKTGHLQNKYWPKMNKIPTRGANGFLRMAIFKLNS